MKKYMKYAFLIFFIILAILSFLIIQPFLTAILASIIVAYIFYPLHKLLKKKVKNRNLSALLLMILIVILLAIITGFIGRELYSEVNTLITKGNFEDTFEQINMRCDQADSLTCQSIDYIVEVLEDPQTKSSIISAISRFSKSLIVSIPSLILSLVIFIFTTFFLFRDGDDIIKYVNNLLPLKKGFKKSLKKQTKDLFYSTLYGTLVVAIIQGIVGIIAFMIFDSTDSPFFWGAIMAVGALIPFVGTGIVWLPMSIIQILTGYFSETPSVIWKGVGLLAVGAVIISSIDNVIKPKIIGDKSGLHPLLVMLGAFGGIALMGFIGVFVGPMILAFFISFLRVYHEEKNEIFEGC
ncbi:AI-2E family transporter [Candidatus Woesearchaeota archaeon]|nr:AI-2E family transporter [Candidatus Woesearchaeota archaeon]